MKVNVKILRGAECTLDVQPDLQVSELKKMVESKLKVPVHDQKLLLRGKLLLGYERPQTLNHYFNNQPLFLVNPRPPTKVSNYWKKLTDYDIKEDTKLNLVVLDNKESAPNTSKSPKKDILEIEMTKFLRRYFSDSDAKKVVAEYMKEFYRKTSSCNLEDWERIATGYLNEEKEQNQKTYNLRRSKN